MPASLLEKKMDYMQGSKFNVVYADIRDFMDVNEDIYYQKLNKYIKAANERGIQVDVVVGEHS